MESIMKYISRTSRLSILYRSDELEKYELNGIQHTYILNICNNPGISQEQLAKLIFVNKSNVARQLALLEQTGFITRIPSEADRRQMRVYPTEKALENYPKVLEVLHEWNARLLEDFSEEEQLLLISMMKKVMNKAVDIMEQNDGKADKKQ